MLLEMLYRNLAAYLVFFTMLGVTWIYGGTRPEPLYTTLPWMLALSVEGLLFFPQRRPYEDMVQARERTWRCLGRDPLLYVVIVFMVLLIVPIFNRGLCPNCDCQAIAAGADPKPIPMLPFCVNVADHVKVFTWFVPAFLSALAIRHALTREGKRLLFEMMVWNGVALGVFGFIEQATGASFVFWEKPEHPVYFFSVFGYPNAAGSFFTMMFAFSIGLWRYHAKETDFMRKADAESQVPSKTMYWLHAHYPLVAVVLTLFALFYPRIFAVTFDELFARATGVPAGGYNMLIALLTAVTIVVGMRMMGTLLISSLIIFPALSSMHLFSSFRAVTISSAIISVACFALGLMLSCVYSLPTGAGIVAINLVVFIAFSAIDATR